MNLSLNFFGVKTIKSIKLSDWLILIPLSIIVGVIPLIVFLEVIPIPNEYAKYWHKDYGEPLKTY